MAKGLALARAIGLKWPAAASDQDADADTIVEKALTAELVDAEPVPLPATDPSAAMADALSQTLLETTGQGTAIAAGDLRESVTNDAITAIEADIASLLASMNAVTETDAAGPDGTIDAEEATLALLGELDRLWQADPMVSSANAA
jgi:hypothetical protein